MGWVDSLRGKAVGIDTMPVIYYIEEHPLYLDMLDPFFNAVDRGDFTVITSIITLLEVLVLPIRNGDTGLTQKCRTILFDPNNLQTVLFDKEVAEEAALLRAFHKIRTPDSIQMATAIHEGASYFLTNDLELPSLPNLKVLTLDALRNDAQSGKNREE